jgi:hypothetical protein
MGCAIDKCRVCHTYDHTSDDNVCARCYAVAREKLEEAKQLLYTIDHGARIVLTPIHARALLDALENP